MTRKTITRIVALLSVLLFSAAAVPNSNGQTIVEDSNISLSGNFSSAILEVSRPTPSSSAGFFEITAPTFPLSTSFTLDLINVTADFPGADFFIAQPGQVFSSTTIAAGQFPQLIFGQVDQVEVPSGQFFEETELSDISQGPSGSLVDATQFYVGIATTDDSDFPIGEVIENPERDIFGWALIEVGANVDGSFESIELLDSAIGFDTGNIIIGQNSFAVPEPSSGIVLATLLGLGIVQRRKR